MVIPRLTRAALFAAVVVSLAHGASWGELPRRPFLGLGVMPLEPANAMRLGLTSPRGAWVHLLMTDAPAAVAGLEVDDVVVAVGADSIASVADFAARARALAPGENVPFTVIRQGRVMTIVVTAREAPVESLTNGTVELGSFRGWPGLHLRSILTLPDTTVTRAERLPAFLILQDMPERSVEGGGYNPYRELAFGLTARGYAVLRWDRRGAGDSEGEALADADFHTETRDAEAALDFLKRHPRVDNREIYLLGLGTGSLIAADLARQPGLAGIVLAGASARGFAEIAREAVYHSARLSGAAEADAARARGSVETFLGELLRGRSIEDIVAEHPGVEPFVLDEAGRPLGRSVSFLRQLAAVDPEEVYGTVECPVALLRCESDPLATPEDAERVKEMLSRDARAECEIVLLPRTDRDLAYADSAEESAENWMTGVLAMNPEVVDRLLAWVHRADESLREK